MRHHAVLCPREVGAVVRAQSHLTFTSPGNRNSRLQTPKSRIFECSELWPNHWACGHIRMKSPMAGCEQACDEAIYPLNEMDAAINYSLETVKKVQDDRCPQDASPPFWLCHRWCFAGCAAFECEWHFSSEAPTQSDAYGSSTGR